MSLSSVSGVESLFLNGDLVQSDVVQVLQDASISRTIEGVSTLTLVLYDDNSKLLKSGIFDRKVIANIDEFRFELVQLRKSGSTLSVTFEDLPVAALRRHTLPLKVAPDTMTHIDFAERLVKEEGWLKFWVPPGLRSTERTKTELTRGDPTSSDEPEDSWAAIGRIADARGWRRYVLDKDTIAYAPETFLLSQGSTHTIVENGEGVENIDFDFDSGKPVSTVSVTARAARWDIAVGSTVTLEGLGPADGKWLVSEVNRSLFSVSVNISLTQARPVIPEAYDTSTSSVQTTSGGGGSVSTGAQSTSWWNILGNNANSPQQSTSWWNFAASGVQTTWPDDPSNLVSIGQSGHRLASPAAASFARVEKAFGRQIKVTDSYRSVASQRANYLRNPQRFAPPGDSAHGEARAVDVDLRAVGVGNQSPDPRKWEKDATWKKLNDAFMAEGWCNYQYKKGSTDGRVSEPWHWSYQVCK